MRAERSTDRQRKIDLGRERGVRERETERERLTETGWEQRDRQIDRERETWGERQTERQGLDLVKGATPRNRVIGQQEASVDPVDKGCPRVASSTNSPGAIWLSDKKKRRSTIFCNKSRETRRGVGEGGGEARGYDQCNLYRTKNRYSGQRSAGESRSWLTYSKATNRGQHS